MRILVAHNKYRWAGGEDVVVKQERALLEAHGHQVISFEKNNNEIQDSSKLELARNCLWNSEAYAHVLRIIDQEKIELMHVHNYFPLLSPSVFAAAKKKGIAVVHTLHNFRLSCINGLFLRDGKPCESCLSCGNLLPGIVYKCYHSDFAASSVAAMSIGLHNVMKTVPNAVGRFIVLNEHAREKFVQAGLPVEKIRVKPNFILEDKGAASGDGDYVAFLGRLAEEKGISVLLAAWKNMKSKIRLKIAGDGLLAETVKAFAQENPHVEYVGWLDETSAHRLLGSAKFSVLPSICYESALPLSAIQSLCAGTPVVASRLGAMERLIYEGKTGLLFTPGDAQELANKIEQLWLDDEALKRMRVESRQNFVRNYSAERNYELLMGIYEEALAGLHQ